MVDNPSTDEDVDVAPKTTFETQMDLHKEEIDSFAAS